MLFELPYALSLLCDMLIENSSIGGVQEKFRVPFSVIASCATSSCFLMAQVELSFFRGAHFWCFAASMPDHG